MSTPSFVHLHVHTHYSLLDGATRVGALVSRVKEMGMPAVAITDHGNLFGAIEFYEAATRAGVKPILGCEVYMAPGDRRSRDPVGIKEASYHLLLLAMNIAGYRNLLKLTSIGYREGFYYRPRIDKEVLAELSEGLLCTSTCLGGEIPQALVADNRAAAQEVAETYLRIFGAERFFIELQDHGLAEQRAINPELVEMARRLGVATIATNDVHYLEHGDVEAHDVLCCISTGKLLSDEDRFRFPSDQFYLKSGDEMAERFADHREALANTLRVADMCDLELTFSKRYAPVYQVPARQARQPSDDEYLRELVNEGARRRYGTVTDELRERIDYELEVIASKGFSSYFLIVWDFMRFAHRAGIPCQARGSGCSSVVSYCLDISAPDPLRYGLYFERFMDPDRDEMPDIDVDICQHGRAKVIEYVRGKYGHVAQIITFGTLKARQVVKDVARVLGLSFDEATELTKLIPADLNMTIDKALDREPELRQRYEAPGTVRRVFDIARRLEGLARHAGVHAAGIVVAEAPLDDFLPLYKPAGEDQLVTQYDGPTVEKVGLLKMDFLGLRTLSTLERARQLVERGRGVKIDLDKIDLTDSKVYDLFVRGDTKGVFQFESSGMRDVVMRMKPNRIEDLIAANALYRPGPMENIGAYVARKHGESWTTPHPIMTEVLAETYGIMVYQEQVSRLVNRLGGIELKRAFRLAKAISKKNTAMIEAERKPFLEGCARNGVGRGTAREIFENILKFGGYAFNKAHSTGYALVAFQTAYLKAYYPVEFMAALMTFEMSNTDKIAEARQACREAGVPVLPPDVNVSEFDFVVDYEPAGVGRIRFGLGAIKGVGEKAVEAIVHARQDGGRFRSVYDFCARVDLTAVNRTAVEALINAGAFDRTGGMRKAMVRELDRAIEHGNRVQRDRRQGQLGLFGTSGDGAEMADDEPAAGDEEWTEAEMLAREKAALGFYVTSHPLTRYGALLEACATTCTTDLAGMADGTEVVLGGMVTRVRTRAARSGRNAGRKMGMATIEDLKGRTEVILFSDTLERFRAILVPDAVVFLVGAVDRRREEPSLRVGNVIPVDEAVERLSESVIGTLDREAPDEEALTRFLEVCREFPGDRQVYLEVPLEHELVATVNCGPGVRVNCCPAYCQRAGEVLGPDAVTVLGPRRRRIPTFLPGARARVTVPAV